MLEYHAAYFHQADGWCLAEVVDFPGVASQGKTLRAARLMIRDALKLMAASYVEDGLPLPIPNDRAKPTLGRKADFTETIPLKTQFKTPAV
jgi:predicted RNase H-like HicB family nuclease